MASRTYWHNRPGKDAARRVAPGPRVAKVERPLSVVDGAAWRVCIEHGLVAASGKLAILHLQLGAVTLLTSAFGREAIDAICREAAERLRDSLSVLEPVAHLGDGLFAIALPGITKRDELEAVAERLIEPLGEAIKLGDTRIRPVWTASAVLAPEDGTTSRELLRAADAAAEIAGTTVDGLVNWLTATARASLIDLDARRRELLEFGADGAFFPVFQPQLNLVTGRIDRCEVLMRWRRADGTIASPGAFMDELRALGLLPAVCERVYAEALAEAAGWRRDGLGLERLALNLDVTQVAEPGWAAALLDLIAASELPATAIEVEVSETMLEHANEVWLVDGLEQLRAAGVLVSLDDFGTGIACLTQLAGLPVDLVKLDGRLLAAARDRGRGQAVLDGVVALLDRLNLACVLEGIETAAELAVARGLGIHYGQGFFIGLPMAASDVRTLLSPTSGTASKGLAVPVAA